MLNLKTILLVDVYAALYNIHTIEALPIKSNGQSGVLISCPFHIEKTASFALFEFSGRSNKSAHYYCFGCGTHGDAITLVKKMKNLDAAQSVQWIEEHVLEQKPTYKLSTIKKEKRAKLQLGLMEKSSLQWTHWTYTTEDENPVMRIYLLNKDRKINEKKEYITTHFSQNPQECKECRLRQMQHASLWMPGQPYKKYIYALPKIKIARENHYPIILVEGEKCADTLNSLLPRHGRVPILATTLPHGAKTSIVPYLHNFKGVQTIMQIPDCDKEGRDATEKRKAIFEEHGHTVITLDLWPERNDGYDVSDYYDECSLVDETQKTLLFVKLCACALH